MSGKSGGCRSSPDPRELCTAQFKIVAPVMPLAVDHDKARRGRDAAHAAVILAILRRTSEGPRLTTIDLGGESVPAN